MSTRKLHFPCFFNHEDQQKIIANRLSGLRESRKLSTNEQSILISHGKSYIHGKELSFDQLSFLTGIRSSLLSSSENLNKPYNFSHEQIITLAKFYHVSTDYILGLSNHSDSNETQIVRPQLSPKVQEKIYNQNFNFQLFNRFIQSDAFDIFMETCERIAEGTHSMHVANIDFLLDPLLGCSKIQKNVKMHVIPRMEERYAYKCKQSSKTYHFPPESVPPNSRCFFVLFATKCTSVTSCL